MIDQDDRVRNFIFLTFSSSQDEAATSVGEGGEKQREREREKLGLQGGKTAGPLRREEGWDSGQ